jgi:uncharacterized membrane protein
MDRINKLYSVVGIGALLGVIANFWQTLDKLHLLKEPDAVLLCNLDDVFSCSNILDTPQSALFGFPNSIMALVFFVVLLTAAVIALTGGTIAKKTRYGLQIISLVLLAFGTWFLTFSAFSVGALCIFCIVSFLGLLLINGAWLRINAADSKRLKKLTEGNSDVYVIVLFGILILASILITAYN